MSDETSVIETETGVDNSGDTGSDSGSQQVGSTSSDTSVSAERYWYDDGAGYIDSQTNDPLMINGKYVTTKEQLDEYLSKSQNANAKTNVNSQSGKPQPVVQDEGPVFGKFDPVKSTGFFKTLMQNKTGYQSQLKAPQPATENAQQPGQLPNQQKAAEQQEVDIVTHVQEYKDNLSKYALAPLQRAAKAMQAAGVWTDDNPEAVALSQELQETEANINNLANKKQIELIQKMVNDGKTQEATKKQTEEMQQAIRKARFNVSKDFGGEKGLDWLLIGKPAVDGTGKTILDEKGNPKLIRGPGADLFEFVADCIHKGKGDLNVADAYNKTADIMQSDEQGLRILAYAAYCIWAQENQKYTNARVKEETLKEERARQKNNIQKPQGMNHVPEAVDGMPPELSKFLGLSSV
jgi:hypothetical protein